MGKRRIAQLIFLALPGALFLFPSCQNLSRFGAIHPRVVDTQHPPAVVLTSTAFLLKDPRFLETDYVYPAGVTRQRLVWSRDGEEWIVRLAGAQYAFGGVVFRRAYDFSGNRSRFALMFSVQPAEMVPYLSVGLADGEGRGARVMTDASLAAHEIRRSAAWAYVCVRLDDLDDEGTVIGGAPGACDSARESMDWADIREIRFTGLTDQRPDREVVIRDLRFGPVAQAATATPESAPAARPASVP